MEQPDGSRHSWWRAPQKLRGETAGPALSSPGAGAPYGAPWAQAAQQSGRFTGSKPRLRTPPPQGPAAASRPGAPYGAPCGAPYGRCYPRGIWGRMFSNAAPSPWDRGSSEGARAGAGACARCGCGRRGRCALRVTRRRARVARVARVAWVGCWGRGGGAWHNICRALLPLGLHM